MSLMKDLLERPFDQAVTSKYTAMNGLIYLGFGARPLFAPQWFRLSSGMPRSSEMRRHSSA